MIYNSYELGNNKTYNVNKYGRDTVKVSRDWIQGCSSESIPNGSYIQLNGVLLGQLDDINKVAYLLAELGLSILGYKKWTRNRNKEILYLNVCIVDEVFEKFGVDKQRPSQVIAQLMISHTRKPTCCIYSVEVPLLRKHFFNTTVKNSLRFTYEVCANFRYLILWRPRKKQQKGKQKVSTWKL